MVPISLLIWLALEIAGYLYVGRHYLHADWATAALGALGGVLGIRAGINAVTWVFAVTHASPAPALGFVRRMKLIVEEYFAFLLTFVLVIPFERLWMPPDRLRQGAHPVLLIHGYGCSRGVWWLLRRRLEAAGHSVATVSLAPPNISLGRLEPQLNERIEEVCAATGSRQLTVIGHSMGGLIARCYLARHGNDRIARLITLASPHQGSDMCQIGMGQNAREMTTGSLWLQDMAAEPLSVPTVSLRNAYDNYVMPQDNQRLPGARGIELPPVGHIAMLYDARVANQIIELLLPPKP